MQNAYTTKKTYLGSPMNQETLIQRIKKKKDEQNVLILAHNYQQPEVQDIADIVGDSLELALQSTKTNADIIIMCGVTFMAEAVKILNPKKTVLIPDKNASCPMAAMVEPVSLQVMKEKHPDATVVCYINTTAEVKAYSDICCTSSNGAQVVRSVKSENILFIPDCNLGSYIQQQVPEKNMILWPGICPTHHKITAKDILTIKKKHPTAEVLVHPECQKEVIQLADHTLSTNGMVSHIKQSKHHSFIIGTEKELCYRLKKENPNKTILPLEKAVCPNMKKISLEKILNTLETLEPILTLPEDIISKARIPLQKMMDIGRGD